MRRKVFVLGIDGATRTILDPLIAAGHLPHLARLQQTGGSGDLRSVIPPLSPVAWTGVMTGKNPGKHGIFEFLEYNHHPESGQVNTSNSINSDLIWEIAARYGKATVSGAIPMSYPPRPSPGGFILGDFLSPPEAPDLATDPEILDELEQALGERYQPWNTSVHDGGREHEALQELHAFLDHHLRTVRFLMDRCDWDLFLYDLMATDRLQHELWHIWETAHHAAEGRDLEKLRPQFVQFWKRLDDGIAEIEAALPPDTTLLIISDHGFGSNDWYVNFNVWLLERGYIKLNRSPYVQQKHWFFKQGITPAWIYGLMSKLGMADHRVSRFRGKQKGIIDRLGESIFLSRRHIDWSRTQAYAQGNFGQIFINKRGRQPNGAVAETEVRPLLDRLKAELNELRHPERDEPLIDRIYEREELYDGPFMDRAPDLTVIPRDWRCRTIGLHDFTTHRVISKAFGPTGDHRMEGVLIANGLGIRSGIQLRKASLLDIAPTILYLLGIPIPDDFDGRPLTELFAPSFQPLPATEIYPSTRQQSTSPQNGLHASNVTDEDAVKRRLAELGYL